MSVRHDFDAPFEVKIIERASRHGELRALPKALKSLVAQNFPSLNIYDINEGIES
jgi:hypothetical protein